MDLTVKIPKKYKEKLSERFNYAKAIDRDGVCIIREECPLCAASCNKCTGCPFGRFGGDGSLDGCFRWIRRLVPSWCDNTVSLIMSSISWSKEDDDKAREILDKLHREAKKYITWI